MLSLQRHLKSSPKEYSNSPALSTVTFAAHPINKNAGISSTMACKGMSHTVTAEPRLLKPSSRCPASSLPGLGQHTGHKQKALSSQADASESPGWPHTSTMNSSVPSHCPMIAHHMQVLSLHICPSGGIFPLVLC